MSIGSPDDRPPEMALTHGQALWVLWYAFQLGARGPDATFDSYIKYLRRRGVPFGPDEVGQGPGWNVTYGFVHLMELALALTLKSQGILKTDVVGLLADLREELRPLFVRAWSERVSELGQHVEVKIDGQHPFHVRGVWLDLHLHYLEPGTLSLGPLELVSAIEALRRFSGTGRQLMFRDPVNLSNVAEVIVSLASDAPEVRRGPK